MPKRAITEISGPVLTDMFRVIGENKPEKAIQLLAEKYGAKKTVLFAQVYREVSKNNLSDKTITKAIWWEDGKVEVQSRQEGACDHV